MKKGVRKKIIVSVIVILIVILSLLALNYFVLEKPVLSPTSEIATLNSDGHPATDADFQALMKTCNLNSVKRDFCSIFNLETFPLCWVIGVSSELNNKVFLIPMDLNGDSLCLNKNCDGFSSCTLSTSCLKGEIDCRKSQYYYNKVEQCCNEDNYYCGSNGGCIAYCGDGICNHERHECALCPQDCFDLSSMSEEDKRTRIMCVADDKANPLPPNTEKKNGDEIIRECGLSLQTHCYNVLMGIWACAGLPSSPGPISTKYSPSTLKKGDVVNYWGVGVDGKPSPHSVLFKSLQNQDTDSMTIECYHFPNNGFSKEKGNYFKEYTVTIKKDKFINVHKPYL